MGKGLLGLMGVLVAYLLFWPVPIDPQPWQPPRAPPLDQGVYARNDRLAATEVIARDACIGPEAVAFDPEGRLYTGCEDGRILRMAADGSGVETLTHTGGRPLGLKWTADGLVVADAVQGLLRLDAENRPEVLSTASGGLAFRFVDDVDVAPDGRLYFSDASHRWGMDQLMADFFEHAGTGRLLRFDPATGETETLLDGLYFANGIAVGPDGAYVLVTETARYQITRYWIEGPRAGESELFAANLPGFPDNVTWDPESGLFWVAIFGPRDATLDRILPFPAIRKVLYRLPEALHPGPKRHAHVLGFDLEGRVQVNAQAHGPEIFGPVTSAVRQGEFLYLGSLSYPGIGRVPLSAIR